jgi:SCY1-like protein 2
MQLLMPLVGQGDWKISGLGLTIPLVQDGAATRWEFPAYDARLPLYIQRSFDYMGMQTLQ